MSWRESAIMACRSCVVSQRLAPPCSDISNLCKAIKGYGPFCPLHFGRAAFRTHRGSRDLLRWVKRRPRKWTHERLLVVLSDLDRGNDADYGNARDMRFLTADTSRVDCFLTVFRFAGVEERSLLVFMLGNWDFCYLNLLHFGLLAYSHKSMPTILRLKHLSCNSYDYFF